MDYPIWNLAFGGGVLIGIVAIAHVLVSHFAIGGGFAIAVVETLAVRRNDRAWRDLAKRSSLVLILVSTVFGAISGVGIWVTIGLVQPAATSALIHNYVWGWAAEWGCKVFLSRRCFVNGADGSRDLLFVAEAGLEDVEG